MTAAVKPAPAKTGPLALGRAVTTAWTHEAHVEAGQTWDDYCRSRHPQLRALGPHLDIPTRRVLVKAMRLARMSEAAIASALGVSKSTVHADRGVLGDQDEPDRIWSVDGADRAGKLGRHLRAVERPTVEVETEVKEQAALGMSNRDYVVYLVREHAPRGLTARELDELVDWHRSNLSGTLSHVERQGRLRRAGLRNGMGVYVLGLVEQAKDRKEGDPA